MVNTLRSIYRKICGQNISRYAYIQLTPLTLDVTEDFETSSEARQEEVSKECEKEVQEFLEWTNLDENDLWNKQLVYGYSTVFILFTTYEPEANESSENDPAAELVEEIYSCVILGDQGTILDGQYFKKRCRWVKKHK